VFVPFCCTGLANIRRYLSDGSGTVLAERANEFANVYDARHRPFSKVRGEYLWIAYNRASRNSAGNVLGLVDGDMTVTAVKRYSLDLEDEASYSYDIPYVSSSGLTIDEYTAFTSFDEFDVVDGTAPVAVIGYSTGVFTQWEYKLRCWNADGSIRWTVNSPVTVLATGRILSTVATDAGVWMLWQQSVPGGVTPPDPNDPNPPPPQPTDYTVEVYADLRNKTTGALITRLSLQALHQTLGIPGLSASFANTKYFFACDAGNGRLAVVSQLAYLASTDSVPGPNHRRAAIAAANAGSYSWFRLRRPSTAGSTTAVAGYEPFRTASGENAISFMIAPQSTKGQLTHGLWVHVYSQFGSKLWQWTLDGEYATEKVTISITPADTPPTTDSLVKTIYNVGGGVNSEWATATNADFDDNAALMYVRQVERTEGDFIPIASLWRYRGFGRVWKVRNNQTEQWETPTYTVLSDPVSLLDSGGQVYDSYDQAKMYAWGISIANDRPNDSGTYYLVGAGAF